jgi:hypothetical protein
VTGHDDDAQWRRPAEGTPSLQPPAAPPDAEPAPYAGPPTQPPPPAGWRPPTVMKFPPPRTLPPQDGPRIDAEEQQARTISYGVAMITGAIMLLLIVVLCWRAVF